MKGAYRAPEGKSDEKADPVLASESGDNHDADRSDNGSDHAEKRLAQRGPQHRRADDRGRRHRPCRVAELKGEGDVVRETDGSPKPQGEKERRRRIAQPFRERSAAGFAERGAGRGHAYGYITASSPPST